MKIVVWGCRGSLPSPSSENNEFGGNTSCVQVIHEDTCLILDGGSGIQRLGAALDPETKRIDILLTHLHIDHVVGLGFFKPFYNPNVEIHIWGPASSGESLSTRLKRYFSPPIFPVHFQDLPAQPIIHELDKSSFQIGSLKISSDYICHPGSTIAYRIESDKSVLAYIPDHEPRLGSVDFPNNPDWTSGFSIAENADLLLHDSQYRNEEYKHRLGWGHSSMEDALAFAELSKVKKLLFFHHDPMHSDKELHKIYIESINNKQLSFEAEMCREGQTYEL